MTVSRRRAHATRPRALESPEDWRASAACHDHNLYPPQFWDDGFDGHLEDNAARAERIARAITVCQQECAVVVECHQAFNPELERGQGVRFGVELAKLWKTRPESRL